ncbi:uncharacterized protein LOC131667601 [Phymastichus coffea]|uniref:uncharacterized protein LOC131667601 n=1 Tax=Phymastichus coffea TaxID=108790 RepID=UPI00273BC7D6|nr:uncharacterized protein LOC131667601 [Phymastichus coffea]
MKFVTVVLLLAFVAVACAAKLPLVESDKLQPEAEAKESKVADPRDKRSLIYGYAAPYAAAYAYPYAAYSYPYAYAAPVAYSSAYYPSYYSSYYVG